MRLGYFGGEPLLEWELFTRSAEWAESEAERRSIRLQKTVTTNMTPLTEERVAWLKQHDFWVGLSLDGHAAMHDRLRRMAGGGPSHETCARALDWFCGTNARAEVIVVVNPETVRDAPEGVRYLAGRGMRRISLNPNFYARWNDSALKAWRSAYEEIGGFYVERYRAGQPLFINVITGKIRTRVQDGFPECDRCGFGVSEIAVAPSGRIYPCERLVAEDTGEMSIGDVFSGFDRQLQKKVLLSRDPVNPECASCPLRERCMNWCACINYGVTGSIHHVGDSVCFHEKLSIDVADAAGRALFAEKNPHFLTEFYGE